MPSTIQDIRLRPDYLAMIGGESPDALAELVKEVGCRELGMTRHPMGFDLSPRPRQ